MDEAALRSYLGVELVEISAFEYTSACNAIEVGRMRAFCAEMKAHYEIEGVSEASLKLACRNTLALDKLVREHNLGVVAIQDLDPTLHQLAGIRPCLCPPESAARGGSLCNGKRSQHWPGDAGGDCASPIPRPFIPKS